MNKVSVLIRNQSTQYEGLRTSLGLLLEDIAVSMFVLDSEIVNFDEAYSDNLGFFEEMEGDFYSNNLANVEKYKFQYTDSDRMIELLGEADLIIPF